MADGTAFGNLGDKQADGGGKYQPPCPVEHRPVLREMGVFKAVLLKFAERFRPGHHANHLGQRAADALQAGIQNKYGRPAHQHKNQKADGHIEIDVGEKLNTAAQALIGAVGKNHGGDQQYRQLHA